MQSKFVLLGGLFLEMLCLLGGVAFFSGQHNEHIHRLQEQLAIIEKSAKASEKALTDMQAREKEIANARLETDRKLLDAQDFDGVLRYEFYDRLLREDAERRACGNPPSGGVDDPVH